MGVREAEVSRATREFRNGRWRVIALDLPTDAGSSEVLRAAGFALSPSGWVLGEPAPRGPTSEIGRLWRTWRSLVAALGPTAERVAGEARQVAGVGAPGASDEFRAQALEAEALALLGGGRLAFDGTGWLLCGTYGGDGLMARRDIAALDARWLGRLVGRLCEISEHPATSTVRLLGPYQRLPGPDGGALWTWGDARAKLELRGSTWTVALARPGSEADFRTDDTTAAWRWLLCEVAAWAWAHREDGISTYSRGRGFAVVRRPARPWPVLGWPAAAPPGRVRAAVFALGDPPQEAVLEAHAETARLRRLTQSAAPAIIAEVCLTRARSERPSERGWLAAALAAHGKDEA